MNAREAVAEFINHILIRHLDECTPQQKEFKIRDIHWSFDDSTFEISHEEALQKAQEEGQILVDYMFEYGWNRYEAQDYIERFARRLIMYTEGFISAESIIWDRDEIIRHATNKYGWN